VTDDRQAGPPTLKCIIAWSDRRSLCDIVSDALTAIVSDAQALRLGDDANLVFTALTSEALRDLLSPLLTPDEGLVVFEFESWSGFGSALDSAWLLARGH
jgi:hypothetical protein